jgi:hypothetical protein
VTAAETRRASSVARAASVDLISELDGDDVTVISPRPRPPWTQLWTLESLRYRGSGWWLDRLLPSSPIGLLVVAFALPIAWILVGYALAADQDAFLKTHDVGGQLWFFPLHVICVRMVGGLWGAGLSPALDGLALPGRLIRIGTLGRWASVGALLAAAAFIGRDIWFGLTPDPHTGLIPFDDPDLWDMAALGRNVHYMMLALWCVEWLMFGYLLWLQAWLLIAWPVTLHRADFGPQLSRVLIGDGYSSMFSLLGKTATVALVFALGNLGFIHYTGELIPRDKVEIADVGDFLRNMSDVLSTTLLFVLTLGAVIVFVARLRKAMTRAVDRELSKAGDIALEDMAVPLVLTGRVELDLVRLRARTEAQGGLLRAVVFQREVDAIGGRAMGTIIMKSLAPIVTAALKIAKMKIKGG